MEFILHEMLKYKLNNLDVLKFLQVVCFYFASQYYASPVQCRGFREFRGGGGVRAIFKISRGVEECSGSMGGWVYMGVGKFSGSRGMVYVRQWHFPRGHYDLSSLLASLLHSHPDVWICALQNHHICIRLSWWLQVRFSTDRSTRRPMPFTDDARDTLVGYRAITLKRIDLWLW